ncbi:hypothetical protein Shell_0869 [Staphylothermus hellenicus DSM 12710]|uniref:DUF4350 domain-containing protein n=2 Tax=Staphylothermus hellenicus TaxID=84599 RepID=D7D883_STAHD|nr:hypothetical protein Shell_0869 [Staphylothermus hellenicus DSM 12710]
MYGILLALALFLLVMAFVPSIDDFALDNPLWNGMSLFKEYFGAQPITVSNVQNLRGGSILFIIGPSKNFTRGEASILANYVSRGGVLVVADDFGSANSLLKYMGLNIWINGSLLADPLFKYRSMYLPQVSVSVENTTLRIYYDYGSFIEAPSGGGKCIGYSSFFSYIDTNMNKKHDPDEPYGPFCTVYMRHIGKGTIYVISDSSILINSMINKGDNKAFIKEIISDNKVYVVTDKLFLSPYTILRNNLAYTVTLLLTTSLRYPVAIVLSITSYYAGKYFYNEITGRKTSSLEAKKIVEKIILQHPTWDPHVLQKLIEEVESDG